MRIVILGLSITSSWGNGHAVTYRGLVKGLAALGHAVTFLERDVPWYAQNRDLPSPPWGATFLYSSLDELHAAHASRVQNADLVIVGSYVPDGIAVAEWVLDTARGLTAFYDIDTPVTLRDLEEQRSTYLTPSLVPRFDLYLSFTGGPTLDRLAALGAQAPRPLYCAVDPAGYAPAPSPWPRWELAYLGTWSADRQPALEALLLDPARVRATRRFCVAGPQYPDDIDWPQNVERLVHVAPPDHAAFYGRQRFTLNLTRADMRKAGWSPSVRLFEAACAGAPILTDAWDGLEAFFTPGEEIVVVRDAGDVLAVLDGMSDNDRRALAARARRRVLAEHTAAHRAATLVGYVHERRGRGTTARRAAWPGSL
jgi:spore maturation protein CgeB